jgi:AraC family transcriptional regulator
MNPVGKALWYIESHFAEALSLEAVAMVAGVSRHHMTRAFAEATGLPVIRYLRARRLSEAARALAQGAPDILAVALSAGYGSHEAFTRAFREQFGTTPESVRAQRHLNSLALVEPIKMDETLYATLEKPRFEQTKPLLIAGIGRRFGCDSGATIPMQWQEFLPHLGHVPGQLGSHAYGVCCNNDDDGNFDYVCGVQVSDFSGIPADWMRVRIPAQRYAVFRHAEHISSIRRTCNTIWNQWLPASGLKPADAPFFERYGAEFDSATGMGGLEVWVAVEGWGCCA